MTPVAQMTAPAPTAAPAALSLEAIKAKQQGAWASGDYALIGTTLQIVGEQLCETMNLRPGCKVLDVAAGNGNATLAAARRFCDVTSTDYVDTLLKNGEQRAKGDRLMVTFDVADVEALPYADASYDAVLSTFGVMFTPNQEQAAAEMLRVCRSGGTIAMANWTPDGLIGQVFKTIGKYLPPPAGVKSPALWGTEARIHTLFGAQAKAIDLVQRQFTFRYRSVNHFMDLFRQFYGPIHKAFLALDPAGQKGLDADLRALLDRFNTATDGTLVAPSDYVDVVIRKA
jgi:ubiquinone/menaquinone biosynthesis C-methylase UbiE